LMENKMNIEATPKLAEFLEDPSVSFWLKSAIRSALDRDCVDALRDAEDLVTIAFNPVP
jgi:hypothetical protein